MPSHAIVCNESQILHINHRFVLALPGWLLLWCQSTLISQVSVALQWDSSSCCTLRLQTWEQSKEQISASSKSLGNLLEDELKMLMQNSQHCVSDNFNPVNNKMKVCLTLNMYDESGKSWTLQSFCLTNHCRIYNIQSTWLSVSVHVSNKWYEVMRCSNFITVYAKFENYLIMGYF